MTTTKPQSPAMEFLLSALEKNRKATYGELKAKADEKKLKVFPIMYGRAQALLGIVKSAKRGTGKTAMKASGGGGASAGGAGRRGRQPDASSKSGQIRELLQTGMSATDIAKKVKCTPALVYNVKARMGGSGGGSAPAAKRGPGRPPKAATPTLDGIEGILATVRNADRERAQLRSALEKIQSLIADALG